MKETGMERGTAKRKNIPVWAGMLAFILICAGIAAFLFTFTYFQQTQAYIVWNDAYKVEEDGSEIPVTVDAYGNVEGLESGDTYVLSAQLPEGTADAKLVFLSSASEIVFQLDGQEIYTERLEPGSPPVSAELSLPGDYAGKTFTMRYRFLGAAEEFMTPIPFITSAWIEDGQAYAYANHYGIHAGIYGSIFVAACGLFLFSLFMQKKDFSLLLLAAAALAMLLCRMAEGMGIIFLPEEAAAAFQQPFFEFLPAALIIFYLWLNRRRGMWRYFGRVSLCAGIVLAAAYFISCARGGYFSFYVNTELEGFIQVGYYRGLLYWTVAYLLLVSIAISFFYAVRAAAGERADRQALAMKNELISESCRAIERNAREAAAIRHEMKNHLAALNFLCREGDMERLGSYLKELNIQEAGMARMRFTGNFLLNAILQSYAARAVESHIRFEAKAAVPEELEIADSDLSSLLMNMLDNAFAGCGKVDGSAERYVSVNISKKGNYLAVRCENPYVGEFRKDMDGKLLTSKGDTFAHGYGIRLMEAVAKKYNGILDISSSGGIFRIQTALRLKDRL